MTTERLGIGFAGSGFNARFRVQSLTSVREIDVRGVWSPNEKNAASTAALRRGPGVGGARPYKSSRDMVADPAIDALWLCGPNHARISNIEEIVDAIKSGAGTLRGLASEKPLARNFAEAKKVAELAKSVGLNTGYLENQLFAPDITRGRELIWARGAALTGRPYLARAAEEHSGPHMPWFWQGTLQGGGVLNDMMCHSVEVVRQLLTKPGSPRSSIRPVRISAHIASLKWSRSHYAKLLSATMGKEVDYTKRPSEDFARATIEYEGEDGETLMGEVTTSWSFIGAGLRLSAELLGPEYSMSWNTLDSSLKMFFSREVKGKAGEDLIEKQNAEMGLMRVVAEEASVYGYSGENRHMARAFLKGEKPMLTFEDGLEVVKILMAAYMSAETGQTLDFPPDGLEAFPPAAARGSGTPRH